MLALELGGEKTREVDPDSLILKPFEFTFG
jgi:hypothetical protein